MYEIVFTRKFLKDIKRHSKSGVDFKGKLGEIIELLGSKSTLPEKFKDHKLNGEWGGIQRMSCSV